ncbi:hypothetical protein [Methylobacterium sp. E-045]|uniref:hypothetical protein n=1 Tax=Methylobacterium sp. E-045 TaxID=2836575 RepID=UPI001FB92587|nr:hypothetical protein [Methylobacterium sp. E-045]MCJ2130811.1 hypothetical protein [Methylobacterium sp. E-045]
MRRMLPIIAALVLVSGAGLAPDQARAQTGSDPAACTAFDWPILREQAWFEAPSLPRLESGSTLSAEMPGAVLALKPTAEADLPLPPSREPKPGTFGGSLKIPPVVTPGLYQVTLSDNAWIDVSQDATTTRKPVASTMRPGCPGVSKSVRFQFGTTPILIVVSGAKSDSIRIAVSPAE